MKSQTGSGARGIDGFGLKSIAAGTMLVDHVAAGILERYISSTQSLIYWVYMFMRSIGRLAFPLYAFLLVEGFFYTRSRWKYIGRLAGFALLSEIPFDLVFHKEWLEFSYQNVFFTLTLGFAAIWLIEWLRQHGPDDSQDEVDWKKIGNIVLQLGALALIAFTAEWLHTDYGAIGVVSVALLYYFRNVRVQAMLGAVIVLMGSSLLEAVALADTGLIALYSGKRGRRSWKWFFYLFYPLHLLLIWGIVQLL